MTLEGVAERITTPLLIVHGERDPLIPWEHGKRMVDEASGPSELVLVEGGNHGVNNLSFASFPSFAIGCATNSESARPRRITCLTFPKTPS